MATNNGEVFERIEKKYLLTAEQYEDLWQHLKDHMKIDEYGLSTICNVYYDTDDFRMVRTSLEKPLYKEKLRLRSYGIPSDSSPVFVEIKKKFDGVVYKRRISLPYREAVNYLNHGIRPEAKVNGQILKELDYVRSFYHPGPAMFIAYDRIATYGKEDPSIRITFDRNIRYRREDLRLSDGDEGALLLEPGSVLMEIKVAGAYPLWMASLLSEFEIYPVSFSKYGRIYETIRQNRTEKEDHKCLPA